ncbi:transposase-like protein [Rhizobium sp. BK060]|nr:transposase-like protein [Rhizobium sp. BK060]
MADDHAGLHAAVREVLPDAWFQCCNVHFLRNALDHVPHKTDDACLQEQRWIMTAANYQRPRATSLPG